LQKNVNLLIICLLIYLLFLKILLVNIAYIGFFITYSMKLTFEIVLDTGLKSKKPLINYYRGKFNKIHAQYTLSGNAVGNV
jgi:hypothetical protein